MIPGMCVAFRAVANTELSDLLDAQLARALEQQLTAAPALQPNLSDEELVALLAERRELENAHRALQSAARHVLRATMRDGAPVTSMTGT